MEPKYLRMIRGMKRRGRKDWTVYILRCGDGSLYTWIAKDVEVWVKQHNEGRGAAYTRTRLPVKLLYQTKGSTTACRHAAERVRRPDRRFNSGLPDQIFIGNPFLQKQPGKGFL